MLVWVLMMFSWRHSFGADGISLMICRTTPGDTLPPWDGIESLPVLTGPDLVTTRDALDGPPQIPGARADQPVGHGAAHSKEAADPLAGGRGKGGEVLVLLCQRRLLRSCDADPVGLGEVVDGVQRPIGCDEDGTFVLRVAQLAKESRRPDEGEQAYAIVLSPLKGAWDRILERLLAQADAEGLIEWSVSVDSTIARAHQHATNLTRVTGGFIELHEFEHRAA
ncbi:hypothetical protein GSU10_00680 [Rathayibacter tanaceti]|uniref:Uncharacterized protein n=1 Tax=Rathayibacter tanaceti TaxID=1671680 RepID=A0AAE6V5C2_9MICO|nr:hypothetical protein GSU10_00680 [Rathayibacter tanaceti]